MQTKEENDMEQSVETNRSELTVADAKSNVGIEKNSLVNAEQANQMVDGQELTDEQAGQLAKLINSYTNHSIKQEKKLAKRRTKNKMARKNRRKNR